MKHVVLYRVMQEQTLIRQDILLMLTTYQDTNTCSHFVLEQYYINLWHTSKEQQKLQSSRHQTVQCEELKVAQLAPQSTDNLISKISYNMTARNNM